jgi:hypothetical protein
MNSTPSPSELLAEHEALIGCDALLAELVRQRGEMKLCYDEQDGWFVQFQYMRQRDAWITLDRDEKRHLSPSAAFKAARLAHNDEVERQRKLGRCAIHQIIP